VVKLPKNAIKTNIIQKKTNTRVSRKRTVTLPPKNTYKTNAIRDNILNYYNKNRKDSTGLKLIINDQNERKDHYITKG